MQALQAHLECERDRNPQTGTRGPTRLTASSSEDLSRRSTLWPRGPRRSQSEQQTASHPSLTSGPSCQRPATFENRPFTPAQPVRRKVRGGCRWGLSCSLAADHNTHQMTDLGLSLGVGSPPWPVATSTLSAAADTQTHGLSAPISSCLGAVATPSVETSPPRLGDGGP